MKITKEDCLDALTKAHEDPAALALIKTFIYDHFTLVDHMKETSLYDVLEYADKLVQPLEILAYENEKLKKEINKLRRQSGLGDKYREMT